MRALVPVEVLVTGLNVVDVLVRLPEAVQHGGKHEVEDLVIQGGAPAGNAASVLAALGHKVGFVARMGSDTLSGIARAEFARHGVLADYFIEDQEASPAVAVVEIDPVSGERTVFYSLRGYRSLKASDVPRAAVASSRLVLVDGYELEAAVTMLEAAREAGVSSVVDIEAGEPELLKSVLELGEHLILPLEAGRRLTGRHEPGEVLRALSCLGPGQFIVTDGVRGSWGHTASGVIHQEAIAARVVDTTGCGDAYHGGYASALLDGLDLVGRMRFAATIAARVAEGLGGRANLPSPRDRAIPIPA
ncbi:MAG: PfkB family carbohydrate kinase [Verrucomicrobiia bacterium]